jgi:hypothetical protein
MLNYDELLSNVAFDWNSRPYNLLAARRTSSDTETSDLEASSTSAAAANAAAAADDSDDPFARGADKWDCVEAGAYTRFLFSST